MQSPRTAVLAGLTLSIVLSLGLSVSADELTEGAKASHDVPGLRPSGLDLGFTAFGKRGGSTELQHLGPYARFSLRFENVFSYTSVGYYEALLAFRRRALLIERAELSARTVSVG
ncbi:hypothetical protein A3B21_01205 [Candidatus Uhrbacteria bacterium RIFCSPLOWO2_01_FULL_47_24]|uniref:Uncharacterized protein n=1 Tax=Candidatus Uhrbacteria bacterium RIFCSPLOWO2_01_FULL_47_24 TaxID=1802401 RepID=A0A1F7URU5_9BACT|nr:MAG: hypothetical protein A2753_03485 [Candidatus Uhrbacteria bacterium RIFCSPHIGHO2_01_FULL_47_11]OGL67721.1 MAG: hypothetical protein A3D58_00965 [Candidatus Uhrbacteria bacterium RIFCSPHIGHO2_02_FULL_46_47]OGL75663.1 MAG: hypothetical protein A3F52_04660 [Candidatus Uhrbacteria bacterium RIFCSPHIGHO2_12_FULL_47_11]OGL81012.1 MAG: hypothetical protein A3B21_01205 [Candidatus Uhrbacteria bacterium RIFCSPLOWO2_01_FULL_47_24]OGL84313.1 MAG: hypothetical protein A3J03_00265 [Candidatus Uhrbact